MTPNSIKKNQFDQIIDLIKSYELTDYKKTQNLNNIKNQVIDFIKKRNELCNNLLNESKDNEIIITILHLLIEQKLDNKTMLLYLTEIKTQLNKIDPQIKSEYTKLIIEILKQKYSVEKLKEMYTQIIIKLENKNINSKSMYLILTSKLLNTNKNIDEVFAYSDLAYPQLNKLNSATEKSDYIEIISTIMAITSDKTNITEINTQLDRINSLKCEKDIQIYIFELKNLIETYPNKNLIKEIIEQTKKISNIYLVNFIQIIKEILYINQDITYLKSMSQIILNQLEKTHQKSRQIYLINFTELLTIKPNKIQINEIIKILNKKIYPNSEIDSEIKTKYIEIITQLLRLNNNITNLDKYIQEIYIQLEKIPSNDKYNYLDTITEIIPKIKNPEQILDIITLQKLIDPNTNLPLLKVTSELFNIATNKNTCEKYLREIKKQYQKIEPENRERYITYVVQNIIQINPGIEIMQKYLETIQQLLNKIDQDYKPAFLENIFPALLQIKQTKITETKQNIKYREKELLTIAKLKNPRDIIRYTKEKNNTGKSEIKLTAQDITTYTEEIIKQLKIINTDIREEYIIIFSKILYKLPSIKIINELTKKIESIDKDKRIDFILLFSIILEMDLKSKTNTEKKELLENIKLQDKYNYSKIIQKIIEQ